MAPSKKESKVAKEKVSKRDRFVRLAAKRTSGVIKKVRTLAACSNHASYEYTPADVAKMFGAIQKELDAAQERFRATGPKEKASEFTF